MLSWHAFVSPFLLLDCRLHIERTLFATAYRAGPWKGTSLWRCSTASVLNETKAELGGEAEKHRKPQGASLLEENERQEQGGRAWQVSGGTGQMQGHGMDGKGNTLLYTALGRWHEQRWEEEKQRDQEAHGGGTETAKVSSEQTPFKAQGALSLFSLWTLSHPTQSNW